MSVLGQVIKSRGTLKAKLTNFLRYFKTIEDLQSLNDEQLAELEIRFTKLEQLYSEFDSLQTEYESLSEEKDDVVYVEREEFENKYYPVVAKVKTRINASYKARGNLGIPSCSSATTGELPYDFVRLPKINLPVFDGNFQHWLEFRDTYTSIIHNNRSISNINKFHYLRTVIKGSASLIIQNLDVSSDNYMIAWNSLLNRYDNERLLVNNHLNSLFNLTPSQKESSSFLRSIVDVTNKNLRALASLGQPTIHWDTLVVHFMSKKLDNVTFRQWEEHRNNITGYPTLEQFITFLNNRADLLDTVRQEMSFKHNTQYKQSTSTSNTHSTKTTFESNITCPMCKKNHFLFSCQEFRNLDVKSRLQKMSSYKVCTNCLRPGHTHQQCNLTHCKYCQLKHNTLLHQDQDIQTEPQLTLALSTDIQNLKTSYVLLSTALVKVMDITGRLRTARVLLDSGSTTHYITQHLCEKLGLSKQNFNSTIIGINNQQTFSAESCNIAIQSISGAYKIEVNCFVLPEITKSLPSSYIDIKDLPLPSGIELADPSFNVPSKVDILLGAEIFWEVLTANSIDLGKQRPKLQETKLGWLVSGVMHTNAEREYRNRNTDGTSTCYFSQNDTSQLTRFWELESVSSKHCLSQEEQACEKSFAETTTRDKDGRFVVTIPLKDSPKVLGDSYTMAKRRFLSIERRLSRDSLLKERYLNFMSEYLTLGHMSENTQNTEKSINYYLPHHGVIRESSTTTKLRVVFDASAITSTGKSFNDIQMVGPVIQDDLLSILLRFRQHKYVITGDIEKMYRSIIVTPSQRSLQQILFRFNPSEQIKSFHLNTVTYGTASAPYLATKCLISLAEHCTNIDARDSIRRDFYVDDYLSGGDTISYVIHLCENVRKTLQSAQFNLRKFQSNCSEILQSITYLQSDKQNSEKVLDLDEYLPNKTLELYWDCNLDNLVFSINIELNEKKVTKRKILSLVSQVFDPLGLLGPCTIEAKILMQKLWINKCNWDEEVPHEIKQKFTRFMESLPTLNKLRIPRWVCGTTTAVTLELHTFTDASEQAYGACVYVRTVDDLGRVSVHLLASKNKVAPLKPVTIPRLELCGALLGTRLCTKVTESLTKKFNRRYYWTDSTIVLGWLQTSNRKLKTFVRNRIGEIQDTTSNGIWSYVPSKLNPADLVSRGVKADHLIQSELWWSGPSFLRNTHINFPKIPVTHANTPLPEITLTLTSPSHTEASVISKLIHKKSNYNRLIRTVAYVLKFIKNCRFKTKNTDILSLSELQDAETLVLTVAQSEMFTEELNILKSGQLLSKKSKLISLSPFIDSHNVLRVGGRLNNSNYSYDVKHPILLHYKHHLTHIIFYKYHLELLHAGPNLLLTHIRQSYWPLGGEGACKTHSSWLCTLL